MSKSRYYDQQADEIQKNMSPNRHKAKENLYQRGQPINNRQDYSLVIFKKFRLNILESIFKRKEKQ